MKRVWLRPENEGNGRRVWLRPENEGNGRRVWYNVHQVALIKQRVWQRNGYGNDTCERSVHNFIENLNINNFGQVPLDCPSYVLLDCQTFSGFVSLSLK